MARTGRELPTWRDPNRGALYDVGADMGWPWSGLHSHASPAAPAAPAARGDRLGGLSDKLARNVKNAVAFAESDYKRMAELAELEDEARAEAARQANTYTEADALARGPWLGGVLEAEPYRGPAPPASELPRKPKILQDTGSGYVVMNQGVKTWVSKEQYESAGLEAHLAERARIFKQIPRGTMRISVSGTPEAMAAFEERRRRENMTPAERAAEDNEANRKVRVEQKAEALAPEHRALFNEIVERNDAVEKTLPPRERDKFRIQRAKNESQMLQYFAKMQSDRVSAYDKARMASDLQRQKSGDVSRLQQEQATLTQQADRLKGAQQEAAKRRLAMLEHELAIAREGYKIAARERLARQYANADLLQTVIRSINVWATDEDFERQVKERYAQAMAQMTQAPAGPRPNPPPTRPTADQRAKLEAIAMNPKETPERRAQAQQFLAR